MIVLALVFPLRYYALAVQVLAPSLSLTVLFLFLSYVPVVKVALLCLPLICALVVKVTVPFLHSEVAGV